MGRTHAGLGDSGAQTEERLNRTRSVNQFQDRAASVMFAALYGEFYFQQSEESPKANVHMVQSHRHMAPTQIAVDLNIALSDAWPSLVGQ